MYIIIFIIQLRFPLATIHLYLRRFWCSVVRISRLCCCIPQNDSFQACPYAFKAIKEDDQHAHTPAHTSSSLTHLHTHTHVRSQIDMYVLVSDSAASYYNSSLIFNFQCISLRAFSLFALRFPSSFYPLVFCSHFLPVPLVPVPREVSFVRQPFPSWSGSCPARPFPQRELTRMHKFTHG